MGDGPDSPERHGDTTVLPASDAMMRLGKSDFDGVDGVQERSSSLKEERNRMTGGCPWNEYRQAHGRVFSLCSEREG